MLTAALILLALILFYTMRIHHHVVIARTQMEKRLKEATDKLKSAIKENEREPDRPRNHPAD